ncbi:hypothetical protein [Nocardioides sp. cx-173]|uniref:hypothetical protein n=1 Tax=Nocardioides sp. cx-173 TaxID=2898796 RepID=UPI001E477F6B|nr:hypothetical protein [Nocardioides sp. cx-173]MCD4525242.1 hypothetical protein [Nocardioides sp. cx-173]UGB40955.1 hypothetical protein LQ940_16455 [Nocardioides sp. cx-173]
MTFLGVACKGDQAEIVCDTASYLPNARRFARTSKVITVPHLSAAVTASGDGEFTVVAKMLAVARSSEEGMTFDVWADEMADEMRGVWKTLGEQRSAAGRAEIAMICHLIVVGFSERAGEFVAYLHSSGRDFTPTPITGVHLQPMPVSYRADEETADFLTQQAPNFPQVDADMIKEARQAWLAQPLAPVPNSVGEWVVLAELAREERSLKGPFGRVYVAGDLLHTRLGVGWTSTQKVWSFDDEGDELARMVAGSEHPASQLGPCQCGSGKTFLDCHLAEHLDTPCRCESGRPFRDCCMVSPTEQAMVKA